MTKTKNTRRALLISVLTMTLSFVMLIGTTFAWFTDSVSSGKNKIVAGNLDVEVTHANNKVTNEALDKEGAKLFPVELWEPGVVSYETFTVKNAGSLAFNYTFSLNVAGFNTVKDTDKSLKDVIKLGVIEGSVAEGTTREALVAAVKAVEAKENSVAMNFTSFSDFSFEDYMEGEKSTKEFTIVAYWEPTENDNDYNVNGNKTVSEQNEGKDQLYIDIIVNVVAKQRSYEEDSFNTDYDKTGVSVKGIVGYEDKFFSSVQEAYNEISPFVATLGLEQEAISKGNAEENKKAFDAVYSNNGKITWIIYGEQTIDTPYLFSFGRKASRYNEGLDITNIDIVGGNNAAKLVMNTGVTLPYNWWSENVPTVAVSIKNLTLEKGNAKSISFEPSYGYKAKLTFENCNINGSIHYLYNNDCELTFDGCHFKNVAGNTYEYALFVQGSATAPSIVKFMNNTVEGYARGINLQRANTEFVITNNTFKNSTKQDKGVVQITEGRKFTVSGNTFEEGVVGYAILYHSLLKNATITIENNIVNSSKYWSNETTADSNITVEYSNNSGSAVE